MIKLLVLKLTLDEDNSNRYADIMQTHLMLLNSFKKTRPSLLIIFSLLLYSIHSRAKVLEVIQTTHVPFKQEGLWSNIPGNWWSNDKFALTIPHPQGCSIKPWGSKVVLSSAVKSESCFDTGSIFYCNIEFPYKAIWTLRDTFIRLVSDCEGSEEREAHWELGYYPGQYLSRMTFFWGTPDKKKYSLSLPDSINGGEISLSGGEQLLGDLEVNSWKVTELSPAEIYVTGQSGKRFKFEYGSSYSWEDSVGLYTLYGSGNVWVNPKSTGRINTSIDVELVIP